MPSAGGPLERSRAYCRRQHGSSFFLMIFPLCPTHSLAHGRVCHVCIICGHVAHTRKVCVRRVCSRVLVAFECSCGGRASFVCAHCLGFVCCQERAASARHAGTWQNVVRGRRQGSARRNHAHCAHDGHACWPLSALRCVVAAHPRGKLHHGHINRAVLESDHPPRRDIQMLETQATRYCALRRRREFSPTEKSGWGGCGLGAAAPYDCASSWDGLAGRWVGEGDGGVPLYGWRWHWDGAEDVQGRSWVAVLCRLVTGSVWKCVYIYVCVFIMYTYEYVNMRILMYTYIYTYKYENVCKLMFIHVWIYVYLYISIYTYIFIHVCIYLHM